MKKTDCRRENPYSATGFCGKKAMQMPFGKYAGYDLEEVPKDYLLWLSNNIDLYGDLREAVFDELVGKQGEKHKSNTVMRV